MSVLTSIPLVDLKAQPALIAAAGEQLAGLEVAGFDLIPACPFGCHDLRVADVLRSTLGQDGVWQCTLLSCLNVDRVDGEAQRARVLLAIL